MERLMFGIQKQVTNYFMGLSQIVKAEGERIFSSFIETLLIWNKTSMTPPYILKV